MVVMTFQSEMKIIIDVERFRRVDKGLLQIFRRLNLMKKTDLIKRRFLIKMNQDLKIVVVKQS